MPTLSLRPIPREVPATLPSPPCQPGWARLWFPHLPGSTSAGRGSAEMTWWTGS